MCNHIVGYCYDSDGESFYEVTQAEYDSIDRSNFNCVLEYKNIRWYKFCPECGEKISIDLNYSFIKTCKHCKSEFEIQLTKTQHNKNYWIKCECGLPIFDGWFPYDVKIEMLKSNLSGNTKNWIQKKYHTKVDL